VGSPVPFVHLQLQSSYSLLSSSVRIHELVETAKKMNYEAIALTDENVMYGVIPFYKACVKAGIKPIIGLTLSILEHEESERAYPLVLLAENDKGYENLLKLSSLVQTKEKHGVNKKWLHHYSGGLIAITPGVTGEVETLLAENKLQDAKRVLQFFKKVYSQSLYISIQRHGQDEAFINQQLTELAAEENIPLVATNQVKYLKKEDRDAYECLAAIRDGEKLHSDEEVKSKSSEYYFKSPDEMEDLFHDQHFLIEESIKIARRCELEISLGVMSIPKYPVPPSVTSSTYLRTLCEKGLQERVQVITEQYEERLDYELNIIENMRFSDYFLIVWDFMNYAHEHGILTGPGRGSAAGSLVSYALRITNVDPIQHQLLFERFLNPERISMPDIDIDFPDNKRDQVIQYVAQKYGGLHVAQIITFGTLAAKAAVRDVGRVMGFDQEALNKMSKAIPTKPGTTLKSALRDSRVLQDYLSENEARKQWYNIAMKIEGLPRHTSTHAAGVVISEKPLTQSVAVQEGHDDVYLTQYPMEALQDVGLLKMDFLGLRNLTILDHILKKIERDMNRKLSLSHIPFNDQKTFELLSKGDTTGIFQLESDGMRRVLQQLKPTELEDIVAVNALYRPGPMENIPTYIKRKHGVEKVIYDHPTLKDILQSTHGVIVYQEQIMQIASKMAGFSLGEADLLRRAVSKKERAVLDRERAHFIQGSKKKGYDLSVANRVYDLIVRFADYGFNRSHAVAYSMVAYQLAYLKAHYPLQFFSALLTSVIGNEGKIAQYINELKRKKIQVLPPSINKSMYSFNVEGESIRYSLAAIKHIGAAAMQEITEERKKKRFEDLFDFCARVSQKAVNKKGLEALILSGGFDEFGENRATLLATIDVAFEHASLVLPDDDFGFGDEFSLKPKYMEKEELKIEDRLQYEKDMLGFYLSSHPASQYEALNSFYSVVSLHDMKEYASGKAVSLLVFVLEIRVIRTKKGEQMAFLRITDESGEGEVVAFPRVFEQNRLLFEQGTVLLIQGKIDERNGQQQIVCQRAEAASEAVQKLPSEELYLRIETKQGTEKLLHTIYQHFQSHRGKIPVKIYYEAERQLVKLPVHYSIERSDELIKTLKAMLGEKHVVFKKI